MWSLFFCRYGEVHVYFRARLIVMMKRSMYVSSFALLFLASALFPSTIPAQAATLGYCPEIKTTLQRGKANLSGEVINLQKFLSDYYGLSQPNLQTGYFGPLTQKYVMQFQREIGLPAMGIVGPATRAAILAKCMGNGAITCKFREVGASDQDIWDINASTQEECQTLCTNIQTRYFSQSSGICSYNTGSTITEFEMPLDFPQPYNLEKNSMGATSTLPQTATSTPFSPPTCSLTVDPVVPLSTVQTTPLTWRSTNADYMTGILTQGKLPPNNTLEVSLTTAGSRTYALTFVGPGGQATCKTTVSAIDQYADKALSTSAQNIQYSTSTPPPTCSMSTSKTQVVPFEPYTLTWSSSNADYVTGFAEQPKGPVSGNQIVTLVGAGQRTYTLTFHGPGGQVSCSTSVSAI
jgi:peptidoglycan hydrolase-like protein with peptidoglycan-binding domain